MVKKNIEGLQGIKIDDLYEFLNGELFAENSVRTHAPRLTCMKSRFKFGVTSGYLHFNIAVPIASPKVPNDKAERLLSEHVVFRLIEAAGDAKENQAELAHKCHFILVSRGLLIILTTSQSKAKRAFHAIC